jgi:PAS domain S-box-containing protein
MAPLKKTGTDEILNMLNDGVIVLNEGKIVYTNKSFSDLSDVNMDQITGTPFLEFVSDWDRKKVDTYLNRISQFENAVDERIEFNFIDRTGNEYTVEMKVRTIPYENTTGILCSLTDTTIRKITRNKLEKILDVIPEIILTTSPDDSTQIVTITKATEKLCAIPAEEFKNGNFTIFDIVHDQDREMVIQFYRNIIEKEFDELEYRIISADGQEKWVIDKAEVIYKRGGKGEIENIMHFIRDITERKLNVENLTRALESLRISEKRYKDIIETTTNTIYIVTPEGSFKHLNSAGIKLFGFKNLEEALKANINDHYVDLEQRHYLIDQIRSKDQVTDFPIRIRTVFGEIKEVTITAGAKKNRDTGVLDSYQAIIHDITQSLEKKKIETYRKTMKGLADSINNLAQTYLFNLRLIQDYFSDLQNEPDKLDENLEALVQTANEFENELKRLSRLGRIARDAYSRPPRASSDGLSDDGMYYIDTAD